MSQDQTISAQQGGSDLWVAVGVVVCLGLGAGVTYWLTSESHAPVSSASVALKGAVMGEVRAPALATQVKDPALAAEPAVISNAEGEFLTVSFETLASFLYLIPDMDEPLMALEKRPADQIPVPIKELDGKRVAVKGFMVPDGQDSGKIKTFMLVRDQTVCCYGRIPRMNEWISVAMKAGKNTNLIKDQAVTVFGTLHVGEVKERGVVLSVYRFDADDVAGPLDF